MNENLKKFRKTGKIEYYLKYKEEVSKESEPKKEDGKYNNKRNSNRIY